MSKNRLNLQTELENLLGSKNVWFQPPESIKLKYPCIIYERSTGDTQFADNYPYRFTTRYTVTLITKDPDCPLIEKLCTSFPMIKYDRHFTSNNLNHEVYTLYY